MTATAQNLPPSPSEAVIAIRDLSFGWPAGGEPLLSIPSLEIEAGAKVFIGGPSGSGKSTLLNLLSGVLSGYRGQLNVMGQPLAELSASKRDHFRADHMGYIFQMFNLIPYLGVLDNVLLPCRFSRLRQQRALQQSGSLEGEARRLLAQLDLADPKLQAQPVNRLSVGQQQRVAAARALMGAPELIIADEPTSSLDSDRRNAFLDLILEESNRQNSTLVFVSHDRALQQRFDQVVDLQSLNRAT